GSLVSRFGQVSFAVWALSFAFWATGRVVRSLVFVSCPQAAPGLTEVWVNRRPGFMLAGSRSACWTVAFARAAPALSKSNSGLCDCVPAPNNLLDRDGAGFCPFTGTGLDTDISFGASAMGG